MAAPIFDHEKLDIYRLAVEYVADSFGIAKELSGLHRHSRDQWLRAGIPKIRVTFLCWFSVNHPVILMEPKRLKDLSLGLIAAYCKQEILRCAQDDK